MTNREFFIKRWSAETKITLKALAALPQDMQTLEYRSHPKARSAHQIIGHILPFAESLRISIATGILDEPDLLFSSVPEAIQYVEKNSALLVEALEKVTEEEWETRVVSLIINGRKIYDGTMMNMFWPLLFDTIHHRGQLSTYYRAMGVRNPGIYGPSAEDQEERAAAAAAQAG